MLSYVVLISNATNRDTFQHLKSL